LAAAGPHSTPAPVREAAPAQVRETTPSFGQTPDEPEPFGFKVSWFAVKASDPATVLDVLELGEATPSNWESGIAAVYSRQQDDRWVFVSPPVSGWVLAVSTWWPYPVAIESESQTEYQHDIGRRFDVLFSRLMRKFDDVQFLGSHRVSGFVTWARALNGKPVRIFAYADEVMANFGDQTSEETQLRFANLGGLSPSDATDRIYKIAEEQGAEADRFVASGLSRKEALAKVRQSGRDAIPDETDVTDLAAHWSIDPSRLENHNHPVGLGLAARLPKDLAQ
jgi:hypothetical protein